jgi:hypothetical protein
MIKDETLPEENIPCPLADILGEFVNLCGKKGFRCVGMGEVTNSKEKSHIYIGYND